MKAAPGCCARGARGGVVISDRGLCRACEMRLRLPRKVHTVESALVTATDHAVPNLVGAVRLAAWALRQEMPGDALRFEQGPAACAALLRR